MDGWRAEVFIPFELLNPLRNVPPKAGTRWRANLRWWVKRVEALVTIIRGDSNTPIGTQVGRGQCTDWALDRRPDRKGVVSGDAWLWTGEARKDGLPVSKTPHVGDAVVFQPGVMGAGVPTGHVAYVESVQRDANGNIVSFTVSEQNWNGSKSSTTRTIQMSDVPPNGVDFIG